MALLSREQLEQRFAFDAREVEVEALGGTVRVREFSVGEYVEFRRLGAAGDDAATAGFVAACGLVDEAGANLFNPWSVTDRAMLVTWPPRALTPVTDAVLELSGLTRDAPAAAPTATEAGAGTAAAADDPGN